MQRRRLVALLAAAALAGCGFTPRRAPELPFRTVNLTGFKVTSPMGDALRRAIAGAHNTRLVEPASAAEVVFDVMLDAREKSVMAYTSAGQVREMQLRQRLRFRLLAQGGREVIGPTEIVQIRDMSYNERDALAKEQEEQLLYRAMQDDIALQVLRRLAVAKL